MELHENQKFKLVITHMAREAVDSVFLSTDPSICIKKLSFSLTSSSAAIIFADIFMVALRYMPCCYELHEVVTERVDFSFRFCYQLLKACRNVSVFSNCFSLKA